MPRKNPLKNKGIPLVSHGFITYFGTESPVKKPVKYERLLFPNTLGCVVEYKSKKYLLWHVNSFGKAQLMNPDGTKFSGTPEVAKLKWLYQLSIVHFNKVDYVVDAKHRIISLATGKICFKTGIVRERLLAESNQSEIVTIKANYDMGFLTFREFYCRTINVVKEHIEEFFPPDYRIVY